MNNGLTTEEINESRARVQEAIAFAKKYPIFSGKEPINYEELANALKPTNKEVKECGREERKLIEPN